MNMAIWADMTTPVLEDLAKKLHSNGSSTLPSTATLATIIPPDQADAVEESLRELTGAGMECTHIAWMIQLLIEDRRGRRPPDDMVELVLTGPNFCEIASRDTLVVVDELFAQATKSLRISGYAVQQGETIFRPLSENMKQRPALKVELFLHIQRPNGNTQPERELVAIFLNRFKRKNWPQNSPLPRIYHFPASLDHSSATRASLHAKCIVADRQIAWVSSANFTAAAQKRNIEVGVLLRHKSLAKRLCAHFDFLKQQKILQRIT